MSSIWTRFLPLTDGPWRIQDPNRGIVYDAQDRRIATVPKSGEIPYAERQANLAAIACVPELVAALREAAYVLDQMGVPLRQEFYDLINRATPGAAQLVPRQVREAGVDRVIVSATACDCVEPNKEVLPNANAPAREDSQQATPELPVAVTDPPNLPQNTIPQQR